MALQSSLQQTSEHFQPTTLEIGQTVANDVRSPLHQTKSPQAPLESPEEFDTELLAAFKIESEEQLEAADRHLLALESDPKDSSALNALFRAFHTIKGNAGFMKIDPTLMDLAHDAETVLSLCRSNEVLLQGEPFDLILESVTLLRLLLGALNDSTFGRPSNELSQCCLSVRKSLLAIATQATNPTEPSESTPIIPSEVLIPTTNPTETEFKSPPASTGNESLRVDRNRLDLLMELIGELVIAESMTQQDAKSSSIEPTGVSTKQRNLAQLNRITRTLQELSLSLRMVPLRSTFQKMTRVARDLMRKLNKQVEFVVEGENTELDKTVVDEIGDPLMHMVRNSIDHGIEPNGDDRVAQGKPAKGRVTLRAFHQGGNIHIEIQDDGRGLNTEKILAKAKQQKLISEDAVLTEKEILSLIFEPGFSTADKITDVSGRGVGMDVVRRNIQALRGNIDIATTLGKGSCFTIRLPLTLAIINGLVVRVGQGRFVIPTLSVTELMQFSGSQISTITEKYTILTVRDSNIPLIRLDVALGLTNSHSDSQSQILVVVQDGPHAAAIAVDEVLGQQQVVIKQLGHYLEGCPGVAGGAIMPDGQVGIILDVHGILAQCPSSSSAKCQDQHAIASAPLS